MQEQAPPDTARFIKTGTPLSLGIQFAGLAGTALALFLIPRAISGTMAATWAYLAAGAFGIASLRASRNAMALTPEVDEKQLTAADLRTKRKLKLLLTFAGYAYLILMILIVSGPGTGSDTLSTDITWSRQIAIGFLVLIYVGASVAGLVYKRRFVKRRQAP